jgi:5-formyltetrahydrofolate cyclo-ligase
MGPGFRTKEDARRFVWEALAGSGAARFPFPPEGRIPNFAGAREAAERLLAHPLFLRVRRIKVNPDAPQRYVREGALRRGIVVYSPTPRLRGGFRKLDPAAIPPSKIAEAASLSRGSRWAAGARLEELPRMDVIVAGCVAVTRGGFRCGKGHGYGDLEYAILRELGHPPAPVVTTVRPVQIVGSFPRDPHDTPLALIATPDEVIEVADPPPPPDGIDWDRIPPEALEEMPVLRELARLRGGRGGGSQPGGS